MSEAAKSKNILIIDDDRGLVKMISSCLLSAGFAVWAADSGETGLTLARQNKPDLIILDVLLPKLKGREVCAKLKADGETRDIPVIFLTAKDSPDDVVAELEVGAVAHLTKPVNTQLLLAEVKNVLKI